MIKARACRFCCRFAAPFAMVCMLFAVLALSGCGANVNSTSTVTPTVAIIASPASISTGEKAMLTITATDATAVTVTGSDGSSFSVAGTGGSQAVSPAATTTYTAGAMGAGGTASAVTTVTVSAAVPPPSQPTVKISASPASIPAGGMSTLTVTATNTTTLAIAGSDGSNYKLSANGGTQVVTPAATTTYTVSAANTAGTVNASTIVTVVPTGSPIAPTVTITATPGSISAGSSSTLVVAASNGTGVTVSGSDGSSYKLAASGGNQAVSPAATTSYTATVTGAGGTASASVTVTVVPAVTPPGAPTVTIVASPASIAAGGSSSLKVSATNATTVSVAGSDGTMYKLSAAGGTQQVTPTATTTYTATATGSGGSTSQATTVTVAAAPTVTLTASPTSITAGANATLTVTATNATTVTVTGSDGSSYSLPSVGGTQSVAPASTTTYTANVTGAGGTVSASAVVSVTPPANVSAVNHVIFMLQENHTFDNYFGMLNPYRQSRGWNIGDDGNIYNVDGIDDKLNTSNQNAEGVSFPLFKLASTCIDDASSDWLASYGDVNKFDFLTTRPIQENGFVHSAEGYATNCAMTLACSGDFTDTAGQRAMGYYDQDYLNYYYYMASQFAVSDRWFSPLSSKSNPNRITTLTGGTTRGLAYDPGYDDKVGALNIPSIFQELDSANVSWKVYYTVTSAECADGDECGTGAGAFPATTLGYLIDSRKYLYVNSTHAACVAPTQPSSVVGDTSNYFCIDPSHVAPLTNYFSDLANGTLASFSFIEPGYGINDEHPGSFQPILLGQTQVAKIVNALMGSSSWQDSVFFFSYDEGGGPYDHVPPVPGHSNDNTDASLGTIPDIASISVNADGYLPCVPATPPATAHCDLRASSPGAHPGDAAAEQGFAAQLGFRLPNIVISPFTRRHYVSHTPMDHTAVIKFVENRFIGPSAHLTARDAAQPNLLDFFDFNAVPWSTPPTPPVPVSNQSLGRNTCTPASMGP